MGGEDAPCPQLLDLIHKKREWMVRDGGGGNGYGGEEEKQLELKLGPPGQEDSASNLSLGLLTKFSKINNNVSSGAKRGFLDTLEHDSDGYQKQQQKTVFLQFQEKTNGMETENQQLSHERKASTDTAAKNSCSQSRTAAPVVGWPPVRSFRKNLASSSLKTSSKIGIPETPEKHDKSINGMFVKINMDGIPIGRKVDLKAYDNYSDLSSAVNKLFKDLLAAQKESATTPACDVSAEEKAVIKGLLDGSGDYTLVYEDNEGDRLLVGDVPWGMFISTAKRLRVLKTSELSAFIR